MSFTCMLISVVHLYGYLFPLLAQQIPAPQDFMVPGIGHLFDGRHDLPPNSTACVNLAFQFLLCLDDPLYSPGQCLAIRGPAGHTGKQWGHPVGLAVQPLHFLGKLFFTAQAFLVAAQPSDFFIIGHSQSLSARARACRSSAILKASSGFQSHFVKNLISVFSPVSR